MGGIVHEERKLNEFEWGQGNLVTTVDPDLWG